MSQKLIIINHPENADSPEFQSLLSETDAEIVELYKESADFDDLINKILEAKQIFCI